MDVLGNDGLTDTDSEHLEAHGALDGTDNLAAGEQDVIDDLFGRERKKGAIKRGLKVMPRIWPYLKPYRKMAIVSVVLTGLLAALALAEPWPVAFVVDSIIGEKPAPGWVTAIFGSSVGSLIALAVGATLFLTLLSGLMTVLNEYLSTTIDQKMVLDLRSDMFEHAQKLSLAYHDTASTGILMYRLNNQAGSMGQIVVGLPVVAQTLLTLLGMAYISVKINWLLGLLALGTTPFIVYSTTFYTDRIEPSLYRVRGLGAMNLAIAYEAMAMMRVVLAFGAQRREYNRFRKQGEKWVGETVKLTVRQTIFKIAVSLITSAGTAAVIGVGAYQAVQGEISAGQLLVVLSYIAQVYTPLEDLTTTIASFQQWFIGLLMSFDLMDMRPEVTEKSDAIALKRARGEIELDGVEFEYKGRRDVLKDISLTIPPGHAVAIVGPTGAGKSTLVSLLPRFYDPKGGTVRLDGHDVRDLKLPDLRRQFSIVLQDPLLFSGTIAYNIRYGKPGASMDEIVEAAKAANAHDFIEALPKGYETVLGEGGAQISGGERQRIAVARAFLRDAPILILDEPTSSIDSRTESVILDALDRLMQGRTTILIAHRLSTIRSVDYLVVMDHGEIVQRGRHEDLVGQPGLYRQLWEAQTGGAKGRSPEPTGPPSDGGSPAQERQPDAHASTLEPATATAGAVEPATVAASAAPDQLKAQSNPPQETSAGAIQAESGGESSKAGDGKAAAVPRGKLPEERPSAGPIAKPPRRGVQGGSRPKVVLLGMLTKIPVGGVGWLVGQYAVGFKRLGYDVYYVEAHARTPSMFMSHERDDGTRKAAAYIERIARRFGFEGRWAFQALHENGRCYGMSRAQLDELYRDAALIVNMHGGTLPLPEHAATDRLVFLGTDPVEVELEVHRGEKRTLEFLDQHVAHFTWGLNYGNTDCRLPSVEPYSFVPSPPPVVLDLWKNEVEPSGPFTTIGNWRQPYREVRFEGKVYRWSKHQQFMKILDLPARAGARIELALSSYEDRDRLLLAEHGWRVRPGLELSRNLDSYRDYIIQSAGEVSAAKEQNVHFRSGWFSERSATYLAAGRPVILQDTGFGAVLPTGEGLFAFSDVDAAAEALAAVDAEPSRHRRAALEIAREHLRHEVVLGDMLGHVGLPVRKGARRKAAPGPAAIPQNLSLQVQSRRPPRLASDSAKRVLRRPVPVSSAMAPPGMSVIVPLLGDTDPAVVRMALDSLLLADGGDVPYELLVVDAGSPEPTRDYVKAVIARNRHVRRIRAGEGAGLAAALNAGARGTGGSQLVLLTGDTIAPPGLLSGLAQRLDDTAVGLVAPATNRCRYGVRVPPPYRTYGAMVEFARRRRKNLDGDRDRELDVVDLFCAALRRDVYERVGPLDVRLEIGMLERDYARRIRGAGHVVTCALDLFAHRLGGPSRAPARDDQGDSAPAAQEVAAAVRRHVPSGSTVLVASGGDDSLVELEGREAWHFPPSNGDSDPGDRPADDEQAIADLERLREDGASYLVLPPTSLWWLDHYEGFRRHLDQYRRSSDESDRAVIYELFHSAEEERTA